jgi:hypothetical protein
MRLHAAVNREQLGRLLQRAGDACAHRGQRGRARDGRISATGLDAARSPACATLQASDKGARHRQLDTGLDATSRHGLAAKLFNEHHLPAFRGTSAHGFAPSHLAPSGRPNS